MKHAPVCIVRLPESFEKGNFISRYPLPGNESDITVVREWQEFDRFVLCLPAEENPYAVDLCILYKPTPCPSTQMVFIATGQNMWEWFKKEFLRTYFCKLVGMHAYPVKKNFTEVQKTGELVSQANIAARTTLWSVEVTDVTSAPLAESDPFP